MKLLQRMLIPAQSTATQRCKRAPPLWLMGRPCLPSVPARPQRPLLNEKQKCTFQAMFRSKKEQATTNDTTVQTVLSVVMPLVAAAVVVGMLQGDTSTLKKELEKVDKKVDSLAEKVTDLRVEFARFQGSRVKADIGGQQPES
eukprot:TRINITY_DN41593_c0_g2_i2.p1 TRINITY_DN41593_c0_g2~~TRINITY_DN41593_c0_g2_i2.p1  ORF type:complete len:143 (-),score=10.35 TRINITY_DN41593_c0_g2_i2:113-541(-)